MDKTKRPAASLLAFMADLHHEIRSPVNTILNMTELAAKEDLPPAARNYVETIEKSANSLLTILDDIIELSQDETDSPNINQAFALTDLLEDLKEAIEGPLKSKAAEMTLSFERGIPEWFSGPRGRIRQVLTQICNYSMRQLASRELKLDVSYKKGEKAEKLCFTLFAQNSSHDALKPKDVLRNPRILICQRLLLELGGQLVVESATDSRIRFSFCVHVSPTERSWGEPIFPTPVSCLVGKGGLSSALVARRLRGCGFKVARAAALEDAQDLLDREVSKSQKGIALVDWESVKEEPDSWKDHVSNTRYPLIYYDVPAISMMHISANVSEWDQGKQKIGFVMSPSKGKQIVSEVLRLLGMEAEQLSCSLAWEEEPQDDMTITPEGLEGMKVLVVEDDRINQRIVVELLKKFSIKPVVASTGKAALNAVKKHVFDAIFMDINLPDTDGYRLTEEIKKMEQYRSIPVIALTASTKNRRLCLEAGMDHFLSKPYSETKLLKSLVTTKSKREGRP